jgi:hypothetical protein
MGIPRFSWTLVLFLVWLISRCEAEITEEQKQIVLVVSATFGGISLVCSLFTLLLIYYSKKWTGYLLLLVSLTVSQIVYDFNYIFRIVETDAMCHFTMFLDVWGGLGISFWVNILSFVVAYTVVSSKPIQIFEQYYLFSIYGTLIPVVAAAIVSADPQVLSTSDSQGKYCHYSETPIGNFFFDLYYWGRLSAICLTVLLCTVTFVRLRTMRIGLFTTHPPVISKTAIAMANRPETKAVLITISRMNYYAFAQVLCRSGAAWNEWNYGQYSSYQSKVAAAVCSPSTGILSFFIFLAMQPNAFKTFLRLICCRSVYDEDDKDRFKVSNSVISSKTPSAYESSANSRMSSGIRSIGSHSHFDRESQDLDSPFDTANPFLASLGHDDDWYEDENVILARWISEQRENPKCVISGANQLVHPSQRIKTSSAVYARLLDYSSESDSSTFNM